jgi:hypothetical protein
LETEGFNEHWALYASLCQPCLISYDFVGKYETLDDDIDYIMHDLGQVGGFLRGLHNVVLSTPSSPEWDSNSQQ